MEGMVELFGGIYKNKIILLTGNSGFKGSWMTYWLTQMGARVIGFSNTIPSQPSHWEHLGLGDFKRGDVGHLNDVQAVLRQDVDLVFHLAAQSLVRYSYKNPVETFQTNVMGTVNIIEACRHLPNLKGAVVVTSDKCYENFEDDRPYNEQDRMGGYDPYSASKGCSELVVSSLRRSFFPPARFGGDHRFLLASGRAGNVIGGGDWSEDRLVPDLVKNAAQKQSTEIRNPLATRPWQHVLEPVSGYLLLGQKILQGEVMAADGWNFGPANNETLSVKEVLQKAMTIWPDITYQTPPQANAPHEAKLLRLDCTKANTQLQWKPVWDTETAIRKTIEWYRLFYEKHELSTAADLQSYVQRARELNYTWTA